MTHHSDQEKSEGMITCQKHVFLMPLESARCRDPKLYCKFRTSCIIWFTEKNKNREEKS